MSKLRHIYRSNKLSNIAQKRYTRKYSREYLEEKAARGASIKLGFGDFDGDGDLDGLYPKQRAGVAEKPGLHVNPPRGTLRKLKGAASPTFGPENVQALPIRPEAGPNSLTSSIVKPALGPASITSSVIVPQAGPISLGFVSTPPEVGPSSLSSTILAPEVGPTNLSSTIFVPVYDDQELIISGLTEAQNEDITKHRTPLGLGTFLYPYTGGMPGADFIAHSANPDYIVDQHDLWLASLGQQGKYWRHVIDYSDVHTIYRISNKDGIITYGLREYDKYRPGVPTDTDENIDHWYTAEYVASTFFAIEPKLFTESMLTQTSDP
jgi:hypothetical protein